MSALLNTQGALAVVALAGTILLAALNRHVPDVLTMIDSAVAGSFIGSMTASRGTTNG